MLDPYIPTARYRGNSIIPNGENGITIVGWQRNIAVLNNRLLSLPTIITLDVNEQGVIHRIHLDDSFAGSKGPLCNREYLDSLLKEKYTGMALGKQFNNAVSIEECCCFHLVEVLLGINSYYQLMLNKRGPASINSTPLRFEEEAMAGYFKKGDLLISGLQYIDAIGKAFKYCFRFCKIFDIIRYRHDGELCQIEDIRAEFYLNNNLEDCESISIDFADVNLRELQRFIIKCLKKVRNTLFEGEKHDFYNTNIHPMAFIGLFVQAVSLNIYMDNLPKAIKMLTILQRRGDKPICIGGIADLGMEAHYFKGIENFLACHAVR